MKKVRIISLIVLLITSFVSLDLLINLLGSMITEMNDGIGTFSLIPGWVYFGDSGWTHERFYDAFVISAVIAFVVFVENVVWAIADIRRKEYGKDTI